VPIVYDSRSRKRFQFTIFFFGKAEIGNAANRIGVFFKRDKEAVFRFFGSKGNDNLCFGRTEMILRS